MQARWVTLFGSLSLLACGQSDLDLEGAGGASGAMNGARTDGGVGGRGIGSAESGGASGAGAGGVRGAIVVNVDCTATPDDCRCGSDVPERVEAEADCAAFDLAVIDVTTCSLGCGGGALFVRIANRGPLPVEGPVRIWLENEVPFLLAAGLEPGAVSMPIELASKNFGAKTRVWVEVDSLGDCDPTNDSVAVELPLHGFCAK